jgi:hypothetical protein
MAGLDPAIHGLQLPPCGFWWVPGTSPAPRVKDDGPGPFRIEIGPGSN